MTKNQENTEIIVDWLKKYCGGRCLDNEEDTWAVAELLVEAIESGNWE